jgi:hypothetical protein
MDLKFLKHRGNHEQERQAGKLDLDHIVAGVSFDSEIGMGPRRKHLRIWESGHERAGW